MKKHRITRPALLFHGEGGGNTPADREVRFRPYDPAREEKNR